MARHDAELKGRMTAGHLFVAICASHADKPIYERVRLRANPPEDAEKVSTLYGLNSIP
jgi:hypothetical protein